MHVVVYELGDSVELAFGKSACFLHHLTSVPSLGVGIYDVKSEDLSSMNQIERTLLAPW